MRRRDDGAALVLVLAAVAILTALAVELAARSATDAVHAARLSREGAFRRLADSGSEVARGLLLEAERQKYTFWGDPWNRDIGFSLSPSARAVVRLADENGKINLGRLYSHPDERSSILRKVGRLFSYLRHRDSARSTEWREIEGKVDVRLRSPESLLTLDGLRESGLSLSQVFGEDGLCRYLTTFGDGTINLNTAPRAVLFALDEDIDEAQADRIAAFRGKGDGLPGSYKPFQDPRDLVLVDGIVLRVYIDGQEKITRNVFERVQGTVTVRSSCFSACTRSDVDGRRRVAFSFFRPDGTRIGVEEVAP
jgi:hypothetical protein